jgi:CheY-like chemotaxis protein
VTASSAGSGVPKRVLIVEDDDDAREVIGELIDALGHEAVAVASAREAVQRVQEQKLDVALIDLSLPETDGYEVARRIRATLAGAPMRLVALTGYSDASTRKRASEAGFDDFLVKPAQLSALEAIVNMPLATHL